jgi:hypothetical protein
VWFATAGTAAVLAYAIVQTLAGRSRTDCTPLTLTLVAAGCLGLALPAVAVLTALCGRLMAPGSRPRGPTGA